VIKKEGVVMHRNLKHDNFKKYSKPGGFSFEKGATTVLDEFRVKFEVSTGAVPMDLS
jgi:hypothetical protein